MFQQTPSRSKLCTVQPLAWRQTYTTKVRVIGILNLPVHSAHVILVEAPALLVRYTARINLTRLFQNHEALLESLPCHSYKPSKNHLTLRSVWLRELYSDLLNDFT